MQINDGKTCYKPLKESLSRTVMEYLHVDTLDMKRTSNGAKYIFVFIDSFSGYIWLEPAKSKEKEDGARAVLKVIGNYGTPLAITSDNGGEFANKIMKELSNSFNIKWNYTIPDNHHSNGSAERAIRTVRPTVLKMTMDLVGNLKDWDEVLPMAQLLINSKVNKNPLSSAFNMMFFRNPSFLKRTEIDGELKTIEDLKLHELQSEKEEFRDLDYINDENDNVMKDNNMEVLNLKNKPTIINNKYKEEDFDEIKRILPNSGKSRSGREIKLKIPDGQSAH